MLLALTPVSGNAHAALYMGLAHNEPCLDKHADRGSKPAEDHHPDKACCCDCLGCTFAVALSRDLTSAPVELRGVVRYAAPDEYLDDRAILPEPDPPRPITLI